MKQVFIELLNPSRSYLAGQLLQGRVVVQNDKPLKVKEVTIMLEGKGQVHWTETESYTTYETRTVNGRTERTPRTHTRVVNYTASEIYISQKISLAGDGHNLIELAKGTLFYPFQFVLPTNCPSSFTSRTGLVSYFIEAELRRPMLKRNKRMALPFTVNGIFDLNIEFGASQPQQLQKVKGSNYFACRKGQLGFVLKLPRRSGFVPGEVLDFSAEVTNSSNRKINGMKATLVQVIQFHAQGKTRYERKVIREVKGPEVEKGDDEMWIPHSIIIPPLPPTRLGGICRIIDVQYFICFEVNISGLSSTLSGELPVMIGTIPLRSTFDELRQPLQMPMPQNPVPGSEMGFHHPHPGPSSAIGFPHANSLSEEKPPYIPEFQVPSAPALPEYPDLPPPSYAEAVSSETFNWTHNEGNRTYKDIDSDEEKITDKAPSAPPMNDYVPNYITYKTVQQL